MFSIKLSRFCNGSALRSSIDFVEGSAMICAKRPITISCFRPDEKKVVRKEVAEPMDKVEAMQLLNQRQKTNLSWWTKFVLVRFGGGKFKSMSEIPDNVSFQTAANARSRFRIFYMNFLMAGILVCCAWVWYTHSGVHDFGYHEKLFKSREDLRISGVNEKSGSFGTSVERKAGETEAEAIVRMINQK